MTPEQKAAYIMAQAASAIGEIFAMHAENARYHFSGQDVPYGKQAYEEVIVRHGLDHNAVVGFFHNDR